MSLTAPSPEESGPKQDTVTVILEVARTAASVSDVATVLRHACRAAIDLLKLDHAAVALFDAEYRLGTIVAEYPEQSEKNTEIPLRAVPAERRMIQTGEPLVVEDLLDPRWDGELSSVKTTLMRFGIHSFLAVPIAGRERLFGSISIDAIGRTHRFTVDEIRACQMLAAIVAPAVERHEVVRKQSELRNACAAISGLSDKRELLAKMVDSAVYLADAKSGGYYEYSPTTGELTVVAERDRPRHLGKILKVGDGVAGHLVLRGEPDFEIVEDYNRHEHRSPIYSNDRAFGSVLEILVKGNERLHGVLYVDDRVDHRFTKQDALFLRAFVERAAVAIENAEVAARVGELEVLRGCADNMVRSSDLREGLRLLANRILRHVAAAFCRVLLLDDSTSSLTIEAAAERSGLKWQAPLGALVDSETLHGVMQFVENPQVAILQYSRERDRPYLAALKISLYLERQLTHLAAIPLRSGSEVIGFIELGDWQTREFPAFFQEHLRLASEIGTHIGPLVHRDRLLQLAARKEALLAALQENSRHLRGMKEPVKLQGEISRLAVEMTGAAAGGLCEVNPTSSALKIVSVHGLPRKILDKELHRASGGIAEAAESGLSKLVKDRAGMSDLDRLIGRSHYHSMICAPIKRIGQPPLVLFLSFDGPIRPRRDLELEVVERYADTASRALQDSVLISGEERQADVFALYHQVSRLVFSSKDKLRIQHAVLTAVTAEYGLGFNRAGVLLFEEQPGILKGTAGIGPIDKHQLAEAWPKGRARIAEFGEYARRYGDSDFPPTPLNSEVRSLTIQALSTAEDPFSRATFGTGIKVLSEQDLETLPPTFRERVRPETPVVLAPLVWGNERLGLMFVDNKFTGSPVTEQDQQRLAIFADLLALALRCNKDFEEFSLAMVQLQQVSRTVLDLTPAQDAESFLNEAVEQIRINCSASGAVLLLVNRGSLVVQRIFPAGTERDKADATECQLDSISTEVIRTGRPFSVENWSERRDADSDAALAKGYVSSLCLPVRLHNTPAGILWVHYSQRQPFSEPRRYTDQTEAAFRIYADHALLVYHSALRLQQQESFARAAEEIANKETVAEVCRHLVECCDRLFDASFSTFWPYDSALNRFEKEHAASTISKAAGAPVDLRQPQPGGATFFVLQSKYLAVDAASQSRGFGTSALPNRIESFQAVLVEVASEPVGVLYVSYLRRRAFTDDDRRALDQFAALAAPAIRRARLLEQLTRAKRAAEVVAEVTVAGDMNTTLRALADGTRNVLPGDPAVVVYSYDPYRRVFGRHPGCAVNKSHQAAWAPAPKEARAVAEIVLRLDRPHTVEDASADDLLKNGALPGFEAGRAIALPLATPDDRVGVMFVGYPTPGSFSSDIVDDLTLYASQAALAIRSAQLRLEEQSQRERLAGIGSLAQVLMGATGPMEVRERALHFIAQALNVPRASMVISQNSDPALVVSVYGWPQSVLGKERRKGRESHAGYVIWSQEPVWVEDFGLEKRFVVPELIRTEGVRSGLGVPIRFESEVIGAMLIHTTEYRRFSSEEVQFLVLAATETAIALKAAEQYEALMRQQKAPAMINQLIASLSGGSPAEPENDFESVVRNTVEYFKAANRGDRLTATVLEVDPRRHELAIRFQYPQRTESLVIRLEENVYYVNGETGGPGIGISGCAYRDRRIIRGNVTDFPDYIPVDLETKSQLSIPLVIERDVVAGVMSIESDRANAFTEEDESVLSAFGHRALLILHHSQATGLLKAASRQLEERDELLATAAHQMKSPLYPMETSIDSLAAYLEQHPPTHQRQRHSIEQSLQRVRDGLEIAKRAVTNVLESTVDPPAEAPVAVSAVLNEVVESVEQRFQSLAGLKNITLRASVQQDHGLPLMVAISETDLQMVLDNLVHNAIQFTPDGGHVDIDALLEGSDRRQIRISVHDDGPGIQEADRDRIFQKYVKAGKTGGMGLGLYICRSRLKLWGGTIWTTTGRGGKGSTFTFLLREGAI